MKQVYRVEFTKKSSKQLSRLPASVQQQVARLVARLQVEPRLPQVVKKLAGQQDLYRARSGRYRLLFEIRDDILLILVVGAGHRKVIYRGL